MAVAWLEVAWLTDFWCSGIASSMHIFTSKDPTAYYPDDDESWPIVYYQACPVLPYSTCGNAGGRFSATDNCCSSSLDTTTNGTWGIASGFDLVLPSTSLTDDQWNFYAPAGSSGQTYAYLVPKEQSLQNLYGFYAALYLNDGSCNDQYYGGVRYFENGTLVVYYNYFCDETSDYEVFTIPSSGSVDIQSAFMGNFTGKQFTITQGKQTKAWTIFIPYWEYSNEIKTPVEKLAVFFFAVSVLGHLAACAWAISRYIRSRRGSRLFILVSQFMWLGRAVSEIVNHYLYLPLYTQDDVVKVGWMQLIPDYLSNFATLSVVMYTAYTSRTLLSIRGVYEYIMYFFLLLLHVGLCGGRYAADACFLLFSKCTYSMREGFNVWYRYNGWWTLFMMTVYVLMKKDRKLFFLDVCKLTFKTDATFCYIFLGQIVISISYFLLIILNVSTNTFGDEKTIIAMNAPETFQESANSVLNFLMIERMNRFVRRKGGPIDGLKESAPALKTNMVSMSVSGAPTMTGANSTTTGKTNNIWSFQSNSTADQSE
ncbi:hypothetical protein HDV03_000655 [Kappamyces sp. JEL0829]|nr:hypothetical protein HDV03_000655 [Kappamyces sp. JEL0829]